MNAFTATEIRKYKEENGKCCPHCGSDNISNGESSGEAPDRTIECKACGKEWWEVYQLVTIEPKQK